MEKPWPEKESGHRLVIAVCKNNRWATWGVPDRAYSFLCHERDRTSLTPPSGEGCNLEDGTAPFHA